MTYFNTISVLTGNDAGWSVTVNGTPRDLAGIDHIGGNQARALVNHDIQAGDTVQLTVTDEARNIVDDVTGQLQGAQTEATVA